MTLETKSLSKMDFVYWTSLVSGGVAGLVVDIVLFPIDTIKTRLQSERGFIRSGGFRGIYKGLAPAAAGSAPTAALFFCTYDGLKSYLGQFCSKTQQPYVHMISAASAEIVACLIRVPVEIAKQRRQVISLRYSTSLEIWLHALKTEGIRRGLYRGFGTTVMREVPFSFIQFPLWEYFKQNWTAVTGTALTPFTVAICGAIAGGIAAGLTTPLDVAKTRIMLADENVSKLGVSRILHGIYRDQGIKGVFAGFVPRVLWITLGGAIFFGFYDLTARLLSSDQAK
ncbi:S-adenosylmethionine mitochondrial carrier protein homolog [Topomyia yanbarensis]|uniref:S-adenosylmethionine mitochondrial carrier protein homolog n=1 Tax=Topomyia yanbarensis TaxID=2498891 RepID=UPI00273CC030|nr:S-adenosylmethionine mitochondrial carrier protein homolog [Topomyia yanbarensis]XP_058821670.1 S-adenosylmethionine mitochondrial carrier protein homolog [Topomyia yanbarensis]